MTNKISTTVSVAISVVLFLALLFRYPEQGGAIIFIGTVPILLLSFALTYLSVTAITKLGPRNYWAIIKQYRPSEIKKMLAIFFNLTPLTIEPTTEADTPLKCLLLELPEYCKIEGNQLVINRKSAADFWVILFVYLFMTACFVVLFNIIGSLGITLFVLAFLTFVYFFIKPYYFPSITKIDFCEKYVKMKGPSFSRWRTFSVENTPELLSTSIKFFHRARYVHLNIHLAGVTYCLKEFMAGMHDDLQLEPASLKLFIEQGLTEGIAPGDLLKKIKLENPTLVQEQATYWKNIRKKGSLYFAQLLVIIAAFIVLLLFL